MLNIIEAPSFITFSKNDIIYRIQTVHPSDGQVYRAYGSRASLSITSSLPIGATIKVSFSDNENIGNTFVLFTVTSTANAITDITGPAQIEDVLIALSKHPILTPYLRFYLTPQAELMAEAIESSKEWTVNFTVSNHNNTALVKTYTKTPSNAPAGYKVQCHIFFERQYLSGNFVKVATREFNSREDGGDIYLNLSGILASECTQSLKENPFADYKTDGATISTNRRRYYVSFVEMTSAGISSTFVDDMHHLINGGIAHSLFLSEWFSSFNGQKAIFSNRPAVKNTRFGVPEWLSFFNYSSDARDISLLVGYGNTQETKTSISVPAFDCVTFSVSPNALVIPPSVKYYWVQILANGTLVSTTRHYIIDSTPYKSIKVLAYLNSFGVPESLICTGGIVLKHNVNAENYESVRGSRSAGHITRLERTVTQFYKEYIYKTGFITAQEKESLAELPLSSVLFDITRGYYIALNLINTKISDIVSDSEETIYSYEFTVTNRINQDNFSPDSQMMVDVSEPQFLIDKGKGNPTPAPPEVIEEPWGTGGGGSGGSEPTAWIWEPLTPILDTDLVLFAKTDDNGKLIGFRWLKSGDYMRHIRGLPLNALSHTVGLGYSDAQGNTQIDIIDNDSKALQTVKELPNELKE